MQLTAWGRYPVIEAEPLKFHSELSLAAAIRQEKNLIAVGNRRSYGDSALFNRFAPMQRLGRLLSFNQESGLLTCEAGVLLADIVEVFLPRGYFLKVTPGTKLITVGGAIASDVHGKNHHVEGCFSNSVESIKLLLADGEFVTCSRGEHRELFLATCGGMGLTGIIVEASFYLKKVGSRWINQRTIKTANLAETFRAFEENASEPYSVAWIDCLQKGDRLGRSLLMVGDFAQDGDLLYLPKRGHSIPFEFPAFVLNSLSVKAFNALYHGRAKTGVSSAKVGVDNFFYPLDALNGWNLIYGKGGFTQYQFILPKSDSFEGLQKMLALIADSGMGSFLAVLKLYGPENDNYLSFPLEGYSLALDFKIVPGLFELLDRLDEVVVEYGGRVYLTKDVRLGRRTMEKGYGKLGAFRDVRERVDPGHKFRSLQSERLGL